MASLSFRQLDLGNPRRAGPLQRCRPDDPPGDGLPVTAWTRRDASGYRRLWRSRTQRASASVRREARVAGPVAYRGVESGFHVIVMNSDDFPSVGWRKN